MPTKNIPGSQTQAPQIPAPREGRTAEIKGTVVLQSIDSIKARGGEEEFARILAELDAETRSVFAGEISPWKWYSLDAFAALLDADIRLTANGDREVLIARSEKVIEGQLRGIYKMFIKLGAPAYVIRRISSVHQAYFNGIHFIPEFGESSKEALIKYVGFEPRHAILGYAIIGFYRKALEISGAKQVTVNFTVPISAGGPYAELKITWV
jgi:hypothetical protein